MARKGDWIQVFSGGQFWPLDPSAEEIFLEDVAHALSNLCRFGGHVPFYSVAQHSVLCFEHVTEEARKVGLLHDEIERLGAQALLHDATEAYLIDVPRPIKRNLVGYKEIEERLAKVMGERFGFDLVNLPREVLEADERMLVTEKRDLLKPAPAPWTVAQGLSTTPYDRKVEPWDPPRAKRAFLEAAKTLGIL